MKLPHVPKGKSPFSEPKTIIDVLGFYTYLLDDGQVWNARKMKPFQKRNQQTVEIAPTEAHPPRRPQVPLVRRSQRPTRGLPPARYGGVVTW